MYFFPVKKLGGSHFQKKNMGKAGQQDSTPTHRKKKTKTRNVFADMDIKKKYNITVMVAHFPHIIPDRRAIFYWL